MESDNLKQKLEILSNERHKYSLYKILNTSLDELTSASNILDPIKNKVQNEILGLSCEQHRIGDSAVVLGINLDDVEHLNREESYKLLDLVYKLLNERYKKLLGVENLYNNQTKNNLVKAHNQDEVMENLLPLQEIFIQNITKLSNFLIKLKDLKSKQLPKELETKFKECNLKSKVMYLQAQLAQEKFKMDVFTETEESLEAYKEIIKSIKQQTDKCKEDVKALQLYKQKFEDVGCKEYNEILSSYLKLQLELENNVC